MKTLKALNQVSRLFVRNWRGLTFSPPGHFYSPLNDIPDTADDAAYWECVDLRPEYQKCLFSELAKITDFAPTRRRWRENSMFGQADSWTLARMIAHRCPARIIEIGSGFSSAVMLDTCEALKLPIQLTFIEPFQPDRLRSILRDGDRATIIETPVQKWGPEYFGQLQAGDVLFIDSSHVVKVGSDIAHLFLRVLPRLQSGVIVHLHDIFYPYSYPPTWISEGRAWNESLFLRCLLVGGDRFKVLAFNSWAGATLPEFSFLRDGGSFWMQLS